MKHALVIAFIFAAYAVIMANGPKIYSTVCKPTFTHSK
jgi:hypothetical protein